MTQKNMGNALQTLGEREPGAARLEEAVTAYRLALEERTRERVPLDWAMTQNNLGNALATLGEREPGAARLEEAVTAYRLALEERTRERVPLNWATTQNNLGSALQTLGEREPGTARLEEAVTAYRLALDEYTRERAPLDWLTSQYWGMRTAALLAQRLAPTASPAAANAYHQAADWADALTPATLRDIRPDLSPPFAAGVSNSACWYRALAIEHSVAVTHRDTAEAACRRAIEIFAQDKSQPGWAMTTHSLAYLWTVIGEIEDDAALLRQAIDLYREGLVDPNTANFPAIVEEYQRDLTRAQDRLAAL